jgi:hypothetical protein
MEPMAVLLLAAAVVVFAFVLTGRMDRARIQVYLHDRRCRLQSVEWRPFGYGWFGSSHERIYEIRYTDQEGAARRAWAKTSALSGVYLSEDRPLRRSAPRRDDAARDEVERLREENRRLRAELDRKGQG